MASDTQGSVELKQEPLQRIQIYPTPSNEVPPFWRRLCPSPLSVSHFTNTFLIACMDAQTLVCTIPFAITASFSVAVKYEREAKKYWDNFYKRHQDRFFKDRHYLDKEWGQYFSGAGKKVVLEIGCGAGNTVFPLVATYPDIYVHACDFSPRAVELVKTHKDFIETRVNAFVCDLTAEDLTKQISPASVDIVTMIFVLSAVSPEKMSQVLQNIKMVLKPNGFVLFRDYAAGDLAQERLASKDQKISENFYVRGDGTRAFYFSEEFLRKLVKENGFDTKEHSIHCKQVENRSREIVMNRRWVQAVFQLNSLSYSSITETEIKLQLLSKESSKSDNRVIESATDSEIDVSEGIIEMFGMSNSRNEIIEVNVRDWSFKIKVLPKENQHTCKSTGLMLWESAHLMAHVLATNQHIVAGKKVLELGCGCGGICSMISTESADLVVATDGDEKALELMSENVSSNLQSSSLSKLIVKRLEWGNKDHIEEIKDLKSGGFDVIIGTDVTYVAEAILPLFATAKELISSNKNINQESEPAFILCHIFRRVDEPSILSAASKFGFRLIARWPDESVTASSHSIISDWFKEDTEDECLPSKALNIMYFTIS